MTCQYVRNLIDSAVHAGCDAVKFQKRDINIVYTRDFWIAPAKARKILQSAKEGLEFNKINIWKLARSLYLSKGIE